MDKVQSIYQGRPARLRETDNSVPILFLDEYEELEPFDTLGYSANPAPLGLPTLSVSTFEQLCKVSTIADRILSALYTEKSSQKDPKELSSTSQSLHAELIEWHEHLPAQLSVNLNGTDDASTFVVLPHVLSLMQVNLRP
jgi:hypothetical protein